jgi:ferric-dicitrate binding protein FerR (iron transport regulator)
MQKKVTKKSPDDLITDFLKGELTIDEQKELLEWIKSDKANKRQFDEYSEIWITSRSNMKNTGYNPHTGFWKFKKKLNENNVPEIQPFISGVLGTFVKYAAVILITVSLSGLLFYNLGKENIKVQEAGMSKLVVPLGSKADLTLSDGTTVTLNAGSSLKFDNTFGIADRVVQLEGEGFFKVAKDTERPFFVMTSHLNVQALGTSFNVKAYPGEKTIETTLIEGSVRVEEIVAGQSPEVMVLIPNQKLTFYKDDSIMDGESVKVKHSPDLNMKTDPGPKTVKIPKAITENINVEPVISWKENKWIFEKQSLRQIAVDLERKFDVQISFKSERLKNFRFTGTIIAEPIEQVLEVMSLSAPISFSVKGRVVTLSENKNFNDLNKNLYNQ